MIDYLAKAKNFACPTIYPKLERNRWIHTLSESISIKWNAYDLSLPLSLSLYIYIYLINIK